MRLPEGLVLYRGLGGNSDLPDAFFQRDLHGCCGFAEWGFMSTSSSKQVALDYTGINSDKPLPLLLAVRVGAADRGACVRDFSQYATEMEYLFAPCSFVEPEDAESLEVTGAGVVRVIPVRVRANALSTTVEELENRKKSLHMSAFRYLIHEVELQLQAAAQGAEERLHQDPSREEGHSVGGLVARIVEQCKAVHSRHEAASVGDFNNDTRFRQLALEMVAVRDMAAAKLSEWLENRATSFIRYRLNAELRTVHRRYIAFLERALLRDPSGRRERSLRLLKTRGWVADSVEEVNELGENRLMAAAAEGKTSVLQLLVDASASVNGARPKDGVTAMWLAAQFGQTDTVKALADLKADVNQVANDGASPVYIAAQGGNWECIKQLAELGADVHRADAKGASPAHQAAMNGHERTLEELKKLGADLRAVNQAGQTPMDCAKLNNHKECALAIGRLLGKADVDAAANGTAAASGETAPAGTRKLIISTGDVSDVDGFMALAEYARTGADVLFVMNYPAYVGVGPDEVDPAYAETHPGLGYRYSAKEVLQSPKLPSPLPTEYVRFLEAYDGRAGGDNERVKAALTDMAFAIAVDVWQEMQPAGRLLFCIGGVNSINPFAVAAIKNEVLVYAPHVSRRAELETQEGLVYDAEGHKTRVDWGTYTDIYMDFNGSLAFWNDDWEQQLGAAGAAKRVRGVFVMGGVHADKEPVTMPAIPNVLNRFSSATMNQLYHPERAAAFFAFLGQAGIRTFVVSNNVVEDLTTTDPATGAKTYAGVDAFMRANDLVGERLRRFAQGHHESRYSPPRKPFDFCAALALTSWLESGGAGEEDRLLGRPRWLFYSNVYGTTYVSPWGTWEETRAAYLGAVDTVQRDEDPPAVQSKKEFFHKEATILRGLKFLAQLRVYDVDFDRLDLANQPALRLARYPASAAS